MRRWAAHPPPAAPGPRRRVYPPAGATPRYPVIPRWGFPASIWVRDRARTSDVRPMPLTGLRVGAIACVVTAVLALVAGGAELWRFLLVLRGRTEVLDAGVVRASDLLVVIAGWALLVVGLATAVGVAATLVSAHPAAHQFAGATPPRRPFGLWLPLFVPGWNVWGAGRIVVETEAMVGGRLSPDGRPRSAAVSRWWWASFVLSEVLVVATLLRSLGRSDQALADAIELRIALDLVAALLAVVTAVLFRRIRRRVHPRAELPRGWTVRSPDPTRIAVADPAAARRRSGVLPPTGPTILPRLEDLPVAPLEPTAGEAVAHRS
ncbi:DUF4328 domain-containing protein [Nakamurella sp. A5-74]|uniref:DUF4328 domain-containing protein n=1 Tax=Nakamurella sp. A5-74 TaxID=3158264 RepID=A0AAU8DR96_9ACTN